MEREIDVILPFVIGEDPVYQRSLAKYRSVTARSEYSDADGPNRYRSLNQAAECVHSIITGMTWVRKIHLVSCDQEIDELGALMQLSQDMNGPELVKVNHSDFFEDPDHLPTFNSYSICANFHRIPGFAEFCIYFEDDFLVNRPLSPGAFFNDDDTIRIPAISELRNRPDLQGVTGQIENNTLRLLADAYPPPYYGSAHVPVPFRLSALRHICERFRTDIARSSGTRFRKGTEVDVLDLVVTHMLKTGLAEIEDSLKRREYFFSNMNCDFGEFQSGDLHFICINDAETADEVDERARSNLKAFYRSHRQRQLRFKSRLTIGMATYDDYGGVYFTVQGIRLYHGDLVDRIEFLIVDNNPGGPASEALRDLGNWVPNYRYFPSAEIQGTAARELVFREAETDFVLCTDSHVLFLPGSLERLIEYYERNPDSRDLLQGPLVYDDLDYVSTHFDPEWRAGMYGVWATDSRGTDPDAEPFEIPMQGLGVFSCRKDAWPGLNPRFRGFGGEEGYIHEKFRQRGHRVLCLPFLRWVHRFNRAMGPSYVNTWEDRMRNYFIGFQELGLDPQPIRDHFSSFLNPKIVRDTEQSIDPELRRASAASGAFQRRRESVSTSRREDLVVRAKHVSDYLEEHKIKHWIDFGLLLGAVRQGDMIPHDVDVNFGFDQTQQDELAECITEFVEQGCSGLRLHRHPELGHPRDRIVLTTPDDNDPLSIEFRQFEKSGSIYSVSASSANRAHYFHFAELDRISVGGNDFPCPRYLNSLLQLRYGPGWEIPANWMESGRPDKPLQPKQPVRVVLDGVFDVFHHGHVRLLKRAKSIYDQVVVGLHGDEDTRRNKRLPVVPYEARREIVQSCVYVDVVIDNFPYRNISDVLLNSFDIDYLLHGAETLVPAYYTGLAESERLHTLRETPGISTTAIIENAVTRRC
jgi:cytidyltransferase-like protein